MNEVRKDGFTEKGNLINDFEKFKSSFESVLNDIKEISNGQQKSAV